MNITKKRIDAFIEALTAKGGSSGNTKLRKLLDLDEDTYWKIQGKLIEEGRIIAGRGRGGSVILAESETENLGKVSKGSIEVPESSATSLSERDLYAPLKANIESKWITRFGFDHVIVAETHSQGSKKTGGTFTRPDLTAAGVRQYFYLPKRLEIITFEIKTANAVTIMGVLEAIAHREAAHRAYVIFQIKREFFEEKNESERIVELAQKFGVGIILTEDTKNVETWEIFLDSVRHEPDPTRLDRFLKDLPQEDFKAQLTKWKE